ncbi:hypothetical protein SBV1_880005 [Verrucomicrobia bacterium]|nr:hypothetical protein SBV1_880005 [Verrucomicrobiota bacterium]
MFGGARTNGAHGVPVNSSPPQAIRRNSPKTLAASHLDLLRINVDRLALQGLDVLLAESQSSGIRRHAVDDSRQADRVALLDILHGFVQADADGFAVAAPHGEHAITEHLLHLEAREVDRPSGESGWVAGRAQHAHIGNRRAGNTRLAWRGGRQVAGSRSLLR